VASGYHERMQVCDRIVVADRESECIRCYDAVRREVAKDTVGLTCINALADHSEIHIITSPFVRIAFETERLKVGRIVFAPMLSRKNMVYLNSSFICRNAT
jgi:hypothetical protein